MPCGDREQLLATRHMYILELAVSLCIQNPVFVSEGLKLKNTFTVRAEVRLLSYFCLLSSQLWAPLSIEVGCVIWKGPGRHDTSFWLICIWNHLLKMAAAIGFSFKEWFLGFQLLFPDFYHFHHVSWRMKWAKKLKTNNGQNMSSGPFSHDAAQVIIVE